MSSSPIPTTPSSPNGTSTWDTDDFLKPPRKRTMLTSDEYIQLSIGAKMTTSPLGLHMYRFDYGFTNEITPEMVAYDASNVNSRPDMLLYALTTGGKWPNEMPYAAKMTELVIKHHSDTLTYDVIRHLNDRNLLSANACDYAAKGHLATLKFLHDELGFKITNRAAINAAQSGKVDCLKYIFEKLVYEDTYNFIFTRRGVLVNAIQCGNIACVEYLRTKFPDDPWPIYCDYVGDLRMYMYLIEHGFTNAPLPSV